MISFIMASKKQIAWRKKFAKMAKAGKFKKEIKITKSNLRSLSKMNVDKTGNGDPRFTRKGYLKIRRAQRRKK